MGTRPNNRLGLPRLAGVAAVMRCRRVTCCGRAPDAACSRRNRKGRPGSVVGGVDGTPGLTPAEAKTVEGSGSANDCVERYLPGRSNGELRFAVERLTAETLRRARLRRSRAGARPVLRSKSYRFSLHGLHPQERRMGKTAKLIDLEQSAPDVHNPQAIIAPRCAVSECAGAATRGQ
jgi:hypothetical protein